MKQATQKRLELSTSAVTGRRSNQLSHWAILKVCTFKTTYTKLQTFQLRHWNLTIPLVKPSTD